MFEVLMGKILFNPIYYSTLETDVLPFKLNI